MLLQHEGGEIALSRPRVSSHAYVGVETVPAPFSEGKYLKSKIIIFVMMHVRTTTVLVGRSKQVCYRPLLPLFYT